MTLRSAGSSELKKQQPQEQQQKLQGQREEEGINNIIKNKLYYYL
jgi:hypothetical protein